MRGHWSGDRIVIAGHEGSSRLLAECGLAEYKDITIGAFEALAAHCSYIYLKYVEPGVLDDAGKFARGWLGQPKSSSSAGHEADP